MRKISLLNIQKSIVGSFRNYPILLISSFLLTGIILQFVNTDYQDHEGKTFYLHLMLTGFIALPFIYSVEYWQQKSQKVQWISWILVIALTGLASWQLWELPESFQEQPYRFSAWISIGVLTGIAAPVRFWENEDVYWTYLRRLIGSLIVAALYALVLCVALSLARAALVNLFQIDNPGFSYEDIAILCFVGLFCLLFVAMKPELSEKSEVFNNHKFLKPIVVYVFLPLSLLYLGILYAYGIRMLMLGEWPQGWVTYLVFSSALVIIITYFVCHPLRLLGDTYIQITRRWLFPLLLPLTIIQLMSIWIRISHYGLTFNRIIVLSLGIWLFLTCVYQVLVRQKTLMWFPLSFMAFALWILFSPWSAFELDKKARVKAISQALKKLEPPVEKLPEKGQVLKVSADQKSELSNAISDGINMYGIEVVKDFVPDSCYSMLASAVHAEDYFSSYTALQYLGQCTAIDFGLGDPYQESDFEDRFSLNAPSQLMDQALEVGGYQYLIQFQSNSIRDKYSGTTSYADETKKVAFSFVLDANNLLVKKDNITWAEIPLEQLASSLNREITDKFTLEKSLQVWQGQTTDSKPVKIVLTFIDGHYDGTKVKLEMISGYFLY